MKKVKQALLKKIGDGQIVIKLDDISVPAKNINITFSSIHFEINLPGNFKTIQITYTNAANQKIASQSIAIAQPEKVTPPILSRDNITSIAVNGQVLAITAEKEIIAETPAIVEVTLSLPANATEAQARAIQVKVRHEIGHRGQWVDAEAQFVSLENNQAKFSATTTYSEVGCYGLTIAIHGDNPDWVWADEPGKNRYIRVVEGEKLAPEESLTNPPASTASAFIFPLNFGLMAMFDIPVWVWVGIGITVAIFSIFIGLIEISNYRNRLNDKHSPLIKVEESAPILYKTSSFTDNRDWFDGHPQYQGVACGDNNPELTDQYRAVVGAYDSYYRMANDPVVAAGIIRSRQNIFYTAKMQGSHGSIIISDAGRLFDIPLKYLLAMKTHDANGEEVFKFNTIYLLDLNLDAVQIGLQAAGLTSEESKRVKLLEVDLSLIFMGLTSYLEREKKVKGEELLLSEAELAIRKYISNEANWGKLPFNSESACSVISSGGIASFYASFTKYLHREIINDALTSSAEGLNIIK